MINHALRLWTISGHVCDGAHVVRLSRRLRFLLQALAARNSVARILDAPQDSPLARLIQHRPATLGAVIWPYQCSSWDAKTRLARIREHYAVAAEVGNLLDFPVEAEVVLLDLGDIRDGFRVVLDQPKWFMREGQLTINLFLGDKRLYSLVFSLFRHAGEPAAFIGAVQGRDIEGVMDQYRELTKACHGMRPRDFLIETFRMLCATLGVRHVYAVSNACRHHMSGYFGDPSAQKAYGNYDEIWADRGGVPVDATCYRIPVAGQRRDVADISAKKRGMYRQRYGMLDALEMQMRKNCRRLADGDQRGQHDEKPPGWQPAADLPGDPGRCAAGSPTQGDTIEP